MHIINYCTVNGLSVCRLFLEDRETLIKFNEKVRTVIGVVVKCECRLISLG